MSRSYNSRKGSRKGHERKDDYVVMGLCHKHLRSLPAPDIDDADWSVLRKKEYKRWQLKREGSFNRGTLL